MFSIKTLRSHRHQICFETLEQRQLLAADVLITEFQAINDTTLGDGHGDFSDWIELHNPTSAPVGLGGWFLTDDRDDLNQWALPDIQIDGGEFMVIFASGRDSVDPEGNYHTNFKLSGDGEDLLLVQPDGRSFDPLFLDYPSQQPDVSYGVSLDGVTETLVGTDAPLSFRIPSAGENPTAWTAVDFDDSQFADEQLISGSQVLITEVETGEERRSVEIQNVSAESIDTGGWLVAVNDPASGPSGVLTTSWSLPSEVDAGEILFRSDESTAEGWGATIPWDAEGPGWVMLLDEVGGVQDFVAWGYSDAQVDSIHIDIGAFSDIGVGEHWRGNGASSGTVGADEVESVSVGPGARLAGANQVDSSGIRLNIEPSFVQTLDAGTYGVQEISFAASSNGSGELRAFLAKLVGNGPTYETLWTSEAVRPPSGDSIFTVELGAEQFTLDERTDVYAGVWHDGDAKVRFSNLSTVTNHDNSPSVPTRAGQEITDFSHGGLNNRTYAYDITVAAADVSRSSLVRTGFIDNDSADDFVREIESTIGLQNPDSVALFGGVVSTIAGIGFSDESQAYRDVIQTDVSTEISGSSASLWTRFEFETTDLRQADELILRTRYDDGFQAYLDGTPLVARNAPDVLTATSQATASRTSAEALAFEEFDLSESLAQLDAGKHVLAVHVLNASETDSDLLFQSELLLRRDGFGQFFAQATPGGSATQNGFNTVEDTKFSVDRGLYEAPFDVAISTATNGATIVYTVDGSEPQVDEDGTITNGSEYVTPLNIDGTTTLRALAFKAGLAPTNIDTHTYLFTEDVASQTRQATLSQGFPTNWGSRSSDYGIDPDVVGPNDRFDGVYTDSFADNLRGLPTLSLVLDIEDMFGTNGIYSNVNSRGEAWERPVSAELIYPDGQEGFQIDAGIRMHGGASRSLSSKNNFRLLFKEEYGATKLEFPLFGDGVDLFDTLVLRAHFNDGWGWDGAGSDPLFSRDQWHLETQAAMGHTAARGMSTHLYINGVYWGLYNPTERPDASFAAQTLGGDKDEWDSVNHNGVVDGNADAWNQMLALARSVDQASTAESKWNAYMRLQGLDANGNDDPSREDYLNVENYIDYLMINFYSGNDDWPNRNWYAAREQGADSEGFQFFAWDSEISMDLSGRTLINENVVRDTNNDGRGAAEAYGSLREYDEFQLQFADRVHEHFFNGGVFSVDVDDPSWDPEHPERNPSAARMVAIAERVADAVVPESARWGDQHRSQPYTRNEEWQQELDHLLNNFFPQRTGIVLGQLRDAGLYPDVDAPEFELNGLRQHGGYIDADTRIAFESLTDGSAEIWYTTDGSDPRLPGGDVNVTAIRHENDIRLPTSSTIKARILVGDEWSALTEAVFAFDQSGLRISELHYNPSGPSDLESENDSDPPTDNDDFEFIEVVNTSSNPINLDGIELTQGVEFQFPARELAAGERAVVVRDLDKFQIRYGDVDPESILGEYSMGLSNDSEVIRLTDALGSVLADFEYDDDWWDSTDGEGNSLVVRDVEDNSADLSTRAAWVPSQVVGGTPGQDDFLPADFDRDGQVGFSDFLILSVVFGSTEVSDIALIDLDDDGEVGFGDFLLLSNSFGERRNRR